MDDLIRFMTPAMWLGRPTVLRDTAASTNDEARALIDQGAPHGTLVVADVQTRGRGRRGRSWQSRPGEDLALSLVLRPTRLPAASAPLLALLTGLAVTEALEGFVPPALRPMVKWPNDVRIGGLKVSGVLVEGSLRENELAWAIAGVGINVRGTEAPDGLEGVATSLRRARGGEDLSRDAVLQRLCAAWERRLDAFFARGFASFADDLRARCETLGQRVRTDEAIGVAEAIADDGGLVVVCDDGARVTVRAGDVVEP